MRGLNKAAALLLAPALARASAPESEKVASGAIVTLDVPVGDDGSQQVLTLRLDVLEADQACGEAKLHVNDQPLAQDIARSGQGVIGIDEQTTITASWAFTCMYRDGAPREQALDLTIESLNGDAVEDVSLSALFRQTAPIQMSDVTGASSVERTYEISSSGAGEQDDVGDGFDDEDDMGGALAWDDQAPDRPEDKERAQILMAELDELRWEVMELEELIRAKEDSLREALGPDHLPPPPPPPPHHRPPPPIPVWQCESLQCVVHSLTGKMKHAVGLLGEHHRPPHPHWRHPHGKNHSRPPPPPPGLHGGFCMPLHGPFPEGPAHHGSPPPFPPPPPPPPPHDEDEFPPFLGDGDRSEDGSHIVSQPPDSLDEQPMMPPDMGPPPPPPHGPPHGPPQGPPHGHPPFHHRHSRSDSLIITLGLAAIAFGLFSLCGIRLVHRRLQRLSPDADRRRRRRHHRRHRESREERRARRAERRRAFADSVRALFGRLFGLDEEPKEMVPQQQDERDAPTMEQEISRFREAAAMVGDIVAVEEGRARSGREMEQRGAPPGFAAADREEEALPVYEEDEGGVTESSSLVVPDGFERYSPGSSEAAPSERSDSGLVGGSANDRLGYTK